MPKHSRVMIASLILLALGITLPRLVAQETGYSLRFYGNGTDGIDRVKIALNDPAATVNVGEDFTIEFWMMAAPDENNSGDCSSGADGWITGNIILDRDVFGAGDYGDYGLSLFARDGVIAFGISDTDTGATVCGSTSVNDGAWHHIAVTREHSTGIVTLFVDGTLDGSTIAPTGDISYRRGRSTEWPNDAFLVIGAEKHDYDTTTYPSYSGWIDELRISTVIRYVDDFTPSTEPFVNDDDTAALYHFDEGEGDSVEDASGNENAGQRYEGGVPPGPEWSDETPFDAVDLPLETATPSS